MLSNYKSVRVTFLDNKRNINTSWWNTKLFIVIYFETLF